MQPRTFYQLLTLMVMLALWSHTMPASAHAAGRAQAKGAFIRLVQGSFDAPLMDVYLNGKRIAEAARFSSVTDYVPVKAGSQRVEVMRSGEAPGPAALILSSTVVLAADKDYSLLAVGKLARIGLQLMEDDNTVDDQGQAKVRLVHASPDSPAIDIVTADTNSTRLFGNTIYKSVTPYTRLPAGEYSLMVRPAGTDVNVLDAKGLFFEVGSVTTIYAFGSWSGAPKFALRISTDLRPDIILPVTGADRSST